MDVICRLTLRYMGKNKKRTMAAAFAIILTMTIVTAVNVFAETFLGMLIDTVIEVEGSYHAVFHGLTTEQFEELKKSKRIGSCTAVTNCEEHKEGNKLCVKVEMKRVNHGIFSATQRIAKRIGMQPLPERERVKLADGSTGRYPVSYHMELLEYLGITNGSWMGVGLLVKTVLAMLLGLGCVLIYNAYAISAFEKLNYLGILGSIGATPRQKASAVYWEGIVEGAAGIPVGIGAGLLLARGIICWVRTYFLYEGLSMKITPYLLGRLALSGWGMIFLACFFPARRAVKASVMDLMIRQISIEEKFQKKTDLLTERKLVKTAGMLAAKNVWVRRKNYIANGLALVAAFCLLLDGTAGMRGLNGDYYPKDKRERPELGMWTEVYSNDPKKIRTFYEKIAGMDGVTQVSLERKLALYGVLFQREQLKEGLDDFGVQAGIGYTQSRMEVRDCHTGNMVLGYWIPLDIIGLDLPTFEEYVKKAGYEITEGETAPALVEDYIEVRTEEETLRQSVLNIKEDGGFSFLYSRYGDMEELSFGIEKQVDELRKGEFRLIGTTKEAPACPYYSGNPEKPDGHQEIERGNLRMYLPMDDFERLLESPEYRDTYGKHPADTKIFNHWEHKSIPTYIKFDVKRKETGEGSSFADKVFHRQLSVRMEEEKAVWRTVRKLAAECGLHEEGIQSRDVRNYGLEELPENDAFAFGGRTLSKKEQYFHSQEFILQILGYGLILLIFALSLTSIFQNISMAMRVRRREFAVYQSMGMEDGTLKRMLIAENSLYGLAAGFIGIPVSLLLLPEVFKEFSQWNTIEKVIPWDIIILQFAAAIVLVVAPVVYTAMQLRHLNIIEAVRDESI
ncbi:MAG: ABC transporter permease [Lachnospiraceae bacterium]|nr:ABC transporter permease [Dorea sp.]MCI9176933.1 ABC transporter permease [Lachnospiraceae bacterium]